jgi:hypothetical protein
LKLIARCYFNYGQRNIRGWYCVLPPLGYQEYEIYSIDGSYPKATKVEVLPGRHELIIREYVISLSPWGGPAKCVNAAFDFEAGHKYKIKTLYKGILIEGIKIVDVATGAIIFSQPWGKCPRLERE